MRFGMRKIEWRAQFIKSLKIAAAAAVAIALAGELGLNYSSTAGIITILSIRNTKRETLKSAGNRGLAYLCALALSAACFRLIGFNLWAFGVYLLLFSLFVLSVGWGEALANSSVLVSHFLTEQGMGAGEVINESLLFLIGTGTGILVNLHLHKNQAEFDRLAEEADAQIKGILRRMSHWLPREDKSAYEPDCFGCLEKALDAAKACAAANYNNAVLPGDSFELDYIEMREKQSVSLRGFTPVPPASVSAGAGASGGRLAGRDRAGLSPGKHGGRAFAEAGGAAPSDAGAAPSSEPGGI